LLLVDDDPQMGVIVGMLARRGGLSVRCAVSVEAAWEALRQQRPELVVLDVNLLHRRRQAADGESFAAALFCQSMLVNDIAAGWRAGADYLLAKELVTQPAAWLRRVAEILEHVHGQAPPRSLGWRMEEESSLGSQWGEVLNRALDHPALRSLGTEVVDQMLRRALVRGFGGAARRSWLLPDAGRLNHRALPASASAEAVHRCLDSLVDQVWRLLGAEACGPFEAVLRTGVAALKP
jgi:CheY-like chemotaxis protein